MQNEREDLQRRLQEERERLASYRARELEMLRGGVQSYGIGSRNVARYSLDLNSIREAIKEIEQTIAELESRLRGGNVRRAMGVIIRDW